MDGGHHMPKGLTVITRHHLLFRGWNLDSYQGLIAAMVVGVILAIILEFINVFQTKLTDTETTKRTCGKKLLATVLHTFRVLIGYVLMLFVMTMNIWIYLAVTIGAGIGYFFKVVIGNKQVKEHDEQLKGQYIENIPVRTFDGVSRPLLQPEESLNVETSITN